MVYRWNAVCRNRTYKPFMADRLAICCDTITPTQLIKPPSEEPRMHPIGFLQKQLICRWCTHHLPSRKHNQVVTLILKQLCQHLNRQPIVACQKEVLTTLQNQSPKLQSCRCCTFCRKTSLATTKGMLSHTLYCHFV